MPNEGQVHLNLEAPTGDGDGRAVSSTLQVADLTRPLMSVGQICDNGHRCVFEKDHALVMTPENEVLCRFERVDGLYVSKMGLKPPTPFGRQDP